MTIAIAPKAALSARQPAVGIFWYVTGVLVIDRSTLDNAEAYGECLTHAGGHYECWQEWQALGSANLVSRGYPVAIASTEYDDWPRGRIVYETLLDRFILYADRRLQKRAIIEAIRIAFGISQVKVVIMSDSHYR